jgi:Arylsulfotransferase (ASST)
VADQGGDRVAKEPETPGAIERILFARVEVWVLLLILLLGCLLAIGFGAAVLDAERGKDRFGSVSRAALAVAEIPYTANHLLAPDMQLRVWGSQDDTSAPRGWIFPTGPMTGPGGYLLLSRYDGTEKRHKLELVSLPAMRIVHDWTLNGAELLKSVTHISRFADPSNWGNKHVRQIHPWLEENGDLIVMDFDTPLFRVDPCGKRLWTLQDGVYHHAMEPDAEGNLWVPSIDERRVIAGTDDAFRDDSISKVTPSGRQLYARSVAQILTRHGYSNWLFTNGMYDLDPIHLNDVQPALADGPYWKKGDVFLSLRNLSTIMLYRPSTDEIVWMKRGPWTSQHDVDILDDHRVAVYDNAVEERAPNTPYFARSSQIVVYDFATGQISRPLAKAMKDNNVRTRVGALFTRLPDGSTLIEDETAGRLIIFRPDGAIAAQYLNRAKDGWLYHLGWSRYLDQAKGDIILRNLRKVRCNA